VYVSQERVSSFNDFLHRPVLDQSGVKVGLVAARAHSVGGVPTLWSAPAIASTSRRPQRMIVRASRVHRPEIPGRRDASLPFSGHGVRSIPEGPLN